eukprot:scaffold22681_cov146-Cylindrotheca_fusiformis.AAC.9
MGRRKYRGNGSQTKKRVSDTSSSSSASYQRHYGNSGLTQKDKKIARRYLNEYREKCLDLYNGKTSWKRFRSDSNVPVVIAGCRFPMLTKDMLMRPFLALPKELTGKQRKSIHELCVYANLYHAGAGLTKDERYIAISVFSDGLDHVPDLSSHHEMSFLKFKPWVCRKRFNGIVPSKATKNGHGSIYKLVDQPGECLRDGIDMMDLKEVEKDDLSKTVPPTMDDDNWMLVDSPEKMRQCIRELEDAGVTELAFDLESHNKSKFQQLTSMLQLASSCGKEYVVDTLAPGVWDTVNGLAPVFANPSVVKIGHAIGGMDVQGLHRDFGIFVVNAFDTHEAAKTLKMPGKGLAKVCATYGLPNSEVYAHLKESYQNTDWTKRPLEDPMILYGRYDVHYLIQLRRLMMRDLVKREQWNCGSRPLTEDAEGKLVAQSLATMMAQYDEDASVDEEPMIPNPAASTDPADDSESYQDPGVDESMEPKTLSGANELRMNADLMQVISRSQEICLKLWKEQMESHLKIPEFQSMMVRSQNSKSDAWSSSQLELYGELARWRQEAARRQECTAGFICPMEFLALIALKRPTSRIGMQQLSYQLPEFFETNNFDDLLELVRRSRLADGLDENRDKRIPTYEDFLELQRRRKETMELVHTLVFTAGMGVVVAATIASVLRGRRR